MGSIRIAATADVHSPKYLSKFADALSRVPRDLNLFLFAGDMIFRGNVREFRRVLSAVRSVYDGPIIACFGNEEYDECIPRLREEYGEEVNWLNDELLKLNVKGYSVGLVGSRGSLDRPTRWQLRNISNIEEIYSRRVEVIDELLKELVGCDFTILLIHYAPTYRTLVGEPAAIWPEMGCRRLERVIASRSPTVVVHGHAHKSRVWKAQLKGTTIFNVSLPAVNRIVVFDLPLDGSGQLKLTRFLA